MELSDVEVIESEMKRHGRTFNRAALEAIRPMAIERVREDESPTKVIASYGFNSTTNYNCVETVTKPGREVKTLRSRNATDRPRTFTATQEQQVFRWMNGCDPRQHGVEFCLWTRAVVSEPITEKSGVTLSVTAVSPWLAKLGLTPQKVLQRAYQHAPKLPRSGRAKRFRPLHSWQNLKGPNCLPGYAPSLSLAERVWSHVQRTGAARRLLRTGETLRGRIEQQLELVKKAPSLMRAFF